MLLELLNLERLLLYKGLLVHEHRDLILETGNELDLPLELRNQGGLLLKGLQLPLQRLDLVLKNDDLVLKNSILLLNDEEDVVGGFDDCICSCLLLQCRELVLQNGVDLLLRLELYGGLVELGDGRLERKGCGG